MATNRNIPQTIEKAVSALLLAAIAIYPFFFINKGIDVSDAGYALSKYKAFFADADPGGFTTFLTTLLGAVIFNLFPAGGVLAIRIAYLLTNAAICAMTYYMLKKHMPRLPLLIVLFISTCFYMSWFSYFAYQSLSVLFLYTGLFFLFKFLDNEKLSNLMISGAVMGMGIYARTPNILHLGFAVVLVWHYGVGKKDWGKAFKNTGIFAASAAGAIIVLGVLAASYVGPDAVLSSISGLYSRAIGATPGDTVGYSMYEMLLKLCRGIVIGAKFLFYPVLPPVLAVCAIAYLAAKFKIPKTIAASLTVLPIIAFAAYYCHLGGNIGLTFVAVSAVAALLINGTATLLLPAKQPLLSSALLSSCIIIIIATLGTNNRFESYFGIYLHFPLSALAAACFWLHKKFAIDTPVFGSSKWLSFPLALCVALGILGSVSGIRQMNTSVYRDLPYGELTASVDHPALAGMRTSPLRASQLQTYIKQLEPYRDMKQLTYGSFAIGYVLTDMPPALGSSWPDLVSFSVGSFTRNLTALAETGDFPIIIMAEIDDMAKRADTPSEREKRRLIAEFIGTYDYVEFYADEYFQMYAPRK